MSKTPLSVSIAKVADFIGHRDAIYDLSIGKPGYFYTAGADGWLVKWRLGEPEKGELILKNKHPLYSLHFARQSNTVWTGDYRGNIYGVNSKNQLVFEYPTSQNGIFGFISLEQQEYPLAYGANGVLYRLSPKLAHPLCQISKNSIRTAVIWGRKHLLLGCSDNCIYIYNWHKNRVEDCIQIHDNSVFALAPNLDLKSFFSAGRDAKINYFELEEFSVSKQVKAHLYQVTALHLNPEKNLLLSASMDKEIRIWDSKSLDLLKVIKPDRDGGHRNCINRVLWINANEFISCSDDRCAKHFKLDFIL